MSFVVNWHTLRWLGARVGVHVVLNLHLMQLSGFGSDRVSYWPIKVVALTGSQWHRCLFSIRNGIKRSGFKKLSEHSWITINTIFRLERVTSFSSPSTWRVRAALTNPSSAVNNRWVHDDLLCLHCCSAAPTDLLQLLDKKRFKNARCYPTSIWELYFLYID